MRFHTRAALTTILVGATLGLAAGNASALPPADRDPIDCKPGYHQVGLRCVKDRTPTPSPPRPTPPANQPFGAFDLAQQTTTKDRIHLVGWAADQDTPSSPISVRIVVDNGPATMITAGTSRPDVAATIAGIGPNHGYDVEIPLSGDTHRVCVTAINVGSGVDQSLGCKDMDWVLKFAGNRINYDIEHAVIGNPTDLNLYDVEHTNSTSEPITYALSGSKDVENSSEWKTTKTAGVQASLEIEGKVGVPILDQGSAKARIEISGSIAFAQGKTVKITDHWQWQENFTAKAWRITRTTFEVSQNTMDVPYTINGWFVYNSGAQVPGTQQGIYSGTSTHLLKAKHREYYLNGKPVLEPTTSGAVVHSDRTVTLDR